MKCEYCDNTGEIETDNNGPIVSCPVCGIREVTMTTYLKVKDAPSNVWECWFKNEIDDVPSLVNECYQYFKPSPTLPIERLKRIVHDLTIAGVQSELFTGKLEEVK